MSTTSTFDSRAGEVKKSIALNKGVMPLSGVAPTEGMLSAEQIRTNILLDMRSFVKQAEALRAGSKDRKSVDISLAKLANLKYGFAYDDVTGAPEAFLASLGIDPAMHTIESLMSMPDFEEGYRWLVPEIVREAVRLGLRKSPIYPNLLAAEESVSQPKVTMPAINMSDAMPTVIGEAETIPVGSVSFDQKDVKLLKVGTGIKMTDEVAMYVSLNLLSLYMQDVGVKLNTALDAMAIETLINGDQADGSDAIAVIGAGTANTLAYRDILRAWIRLGILGRSPQNILGNEEAAMDILDLEEFKGFQGGSKLANINLQTPVPKEQTLFMHGAMPTGKRFMFVDRTSALIKLNAAGLKTESERIVQRQISGTYVTLVTGFATMFQDARLMVDYSLPFSANGFPSYMDISELEKETFKRS